MTGCFKVHACNGATWIGELRLSDSVTTLAVADDVLTDAGSLWATERELPDGSDDVLTVLPYHSLSAGSVGEVYESLSVAYPDVDFPSAAVVTVDTVDDSDVDAYVLSDAQGLIGHARAFRSNVVETGENLPTDTAFMLSGVATLRDVSLLVYVGVDFVDEKLVRTRGLKDSYLTSDDEYFLEDLDELPCACEACRKPTSELTCADAVGHNANALCAELARVWRHVRNERPWDCVEG